MGKTVGTLLFAATVLVVIVFSGCTDGEPSGAHLYKGIASAPVPDKCAEDKDDACALFECMVENCWCLPVPSEIPLTGNTVVITEDEAMHVVRGYIEAQKSSGGALAGELLYTEVKSAVKLNSVFYNVFCDSQGEEIVYTVAADGLIFQTGCYV